MTDPEGVTATAPNLVADTGACCARPNICDCGHPPEPVPPGGGATGYATWSPTGETLCYPCADQRQREELRTAQRAVVYLSDGQMHVTTWTGGLLGRVTRSWLGSTRCDTLSGPWRMRYVHVTDVHGGRWHGQGSDAWQAIVLHRTTRRRVRRSSGNHR
ncbi:hypothetical protein GCM10010411_76730 [Actinomadura fulvescens]|uniref:Uncharacterized protein n=1 Tax=Actinomadura fulvescens TaxID=46160 RepID=A0ABN3QJH1_9ACTN